MIRDFIRENIIGRIDEKTKSLISEQAAIISNILDRLDEKSEASEKVRKFLRI